VKYDAYRAVNSGNVAGLLNAAGGFVGGATGSAIEDAATTFCGGRASESDVVAAAEAAIIPEAR
jgi:hypothetical protein